jgi:low affinity Fe/Cu permease
MDQARAGDMQQSHQQNGRGSLGLFPSFANKASQAAGRPSTFALACAIVIVWAVSGPLFGFSDTWQLVINTGTTIVTFLMVFLIQNSQNRDGAAIQVKLDELIRTSAAQNSLVGIEHLGEEELEELRARCEERARAFAVHQKIRRGEETPQRSSRS